MSPELISTWRKWKEEHPDYPLTVQACGQWSKKVRGTVYYFGTLADPDAARKLWLQEKEYLLAGMTPPTWTAGMTVQELLDAHLKDMDERIAAGKLSGKTRSDYLPLNALFEAASLSNMPVASLGPQHFAAVQRVIEGSGRTLRTQKNVIMATKALFNWGVKMELIEPIKFGPRFAAPSAEAIEAEQEEAGRLRFIDRETIIACLDRARPKMKVAILLGINCGFYPGDSIAITLNHLHLDCAPPYHDFRRVKTKRRRMAVLWPETVAAIQDYCSNYRKPLDGTEGRLLLTQNRRAYVRPHEACKLIEAFGRLLDKVGKRVTGVNLGSLRHTYATAVDAVPDQTMIDLTMGHTNKSLQKRVYRQLNLNELTRLKVVAETVRVWLYGTEAISQSRQIMGPIADVVENVA